MSLDLLNHLGLMMIIILMLFLRYGNFFFLLYLLEIKKTIISLNKNRVFCNFLQEKKGRIQIRVT